MEKQHPEQIALPEGTRLQQVDPDTGEFYPWWVPTDDGQLRFEPSLYKSSLYKPCGGKTFELPTNPNLKLENPFDLNNLRIIDPEMVKKAFQDFIENAEKEENKDRLGSILIGTGGTLSMVPDDKGELHPKLTPEFLMEEAGRIKNEFFTSSVSTPTLIDSSQTKIDYMSDVVIVMSFLYKMLRLWSDDDSAQDYEQRQQIMSRFSGFIVCHGTDTLVQSQTYASFMLGTYCPFNVFYVGAQKNTTDRFNDVGANFKLALEGCKNFHKQLPGLCGTCAGGVAGGIYNGATSLKENDSHAKFLKDYAPGGQIVNAENFDKSPNLIFLEELNKEISNCDWIKKDFSIPPIVLRGYTMVDVFESRPGVDPDKIRQQISDSKSKAVILETYPSFTLDKEIVDAVIKAAREPGKEKLVFAINGSPGGSTDHAYADSNYIMQQGIIPLNMLTHAACAKLDLAFAMFGGDIHKIINFMVSNNFRNEQLHLSKKTTEKRKAYMPEPLSHNEQLKMKVVNGVKREHGTDVSSLILDQDRYQYLESASLEELHMINDPVVRKIIDNNRTVLYRVLGNVLNHIAQEPTFKEWVRESGKIFTNQILRNCVSNFLKGNERMQNLVFYEKIFHKKEDFIEGCRCGVICLITDLLDSIGFAQQLTEKKENLLSTDPYQSSINEAATTILPTPDLDLVEAEAMMPCLGQPVGLLQGKTWKDIERAVDAEMQKMEIKPDVRKEQQVYIDPKSKKRHSLH